MRRFFQLCADIEETVGAVYRQLADSPAGDSVLQAIWSQMALEEEDHARQIRFAARLPEDGAVLGARIPLATLERLRDHALALLQRAKTRTLSREEALRVSLRLEKEFGGVHAHCASEFVNPRMASMFKALAWDDDRHAQTILEYCRTAGLKVEETP